MLEGLDSVNWSALKHAYGPASDVPDLIRQLKSPSAEERKDARWQLNGNIIHQGTRYQASPHAVPFLLELLGDPTTEERDAIVRLLVALAIGYDEAHMPAGVNAERFRAALRAHDAQLTEEDRESCDEFGWSPLADIASYDAVREGVPLFLALSRGADEQLACAAVYALAWFPEAAQTTVRSLNELLKNQPSPRLAAHALLALNFIVRNSAAAIDEPLVRQFAASPSPTLRTAAALLLCAVAGDEKPYSTLINALGRRAEIDAESCRLAFDDIIGIVAATLRLAPAAMAGPIAAALRESLKNANPLQSIELTQALLGVTSNGIDDVPAYYGSRRFSELTSEQQAALKAILDFGGWRIDGAIFANYGNLIAAYGLPATQEQLRAYIAEGGG